MIRADYSSNTKRGGFCIYYKEYLPLIRKNNIYKLNKCVVTEITVTNERCFLTCLYRSPNQNEEQFESFCKNLIHALSGINKQHPTCSILVGDFNTKLPKWCPNDKDSKAGLNMDTFTTTWSYTQMIDQPTHVMNDKSSCIDLLFTINSKCSVMFELSKLFIINAIIISYMDHLTVTYLFLHLIIGKFGITRTQIRNVYGVQFH